MVRSAGLAAAATLDALVGDPARYHPVAGFGRIAAGVEERVYRDARAAGVAYVAILVVPVTLAAAWLDRRLAPAARGALTAATIWSALGGRSLRAAAERMADLVDAGDLEAARAHAPTLVARDPGRLDGPELVRAAVESLAENTADAVGGPLLWAAAGGPAGALAHRAANTLDAMVGYRSPRHLRFGWAAARLDDALNWPVARATAAATVAAAGLCGADARGAWRAWRRDGARHPSPNAGRVEAAFAGALGVTLGGVNDYDGVVEERPLLGDGPRPDTAALRRAVRLSATASHLLAAAAAAWTLAAAWD
jgi:adenosylcobinamide-phosphate synthase